jgi:ribosomal protein S20
MEEMMQRFWKVAGIAMLIAVLGVAVFGIAAFAQDDDGPPFDFHARFKAAVAEILGVTVEEYDAAVEQAHDQVVDEAVTEGWLTEDQAERMRERMEEVPGAWGGGKGFMGPRGVFRGRGGDSPISVAAEKLGMEESDLLAELRDGKSIADLAAEKEVDLQEIIDAYLEQLGERLNQAVQDGLITQNQADSMLEQAGERVPEMLNNIWEGRGPGHHPPGGFPGGHPGRMGYPGASDA